MEPLMLLQGDPLSALTPLILVHAISGIALPYFGLSPLGDDGRPVYGVTSPVYSDGSYRLPGTLQSAAHQYLALIKREVQPTGPYLLGGWSMGGVIALNMARILRQQDETVLHVLMVDSGCPGIYPPFHDRAEHDAIASLLFAAVTEGRTATPPPPALVAAGSRTSSEDGEEGDGDVSDQILNRMRTHIHNGLSMIARANDSECLRHGYDGAVTLIKCSSLARPSSILSSARKAAVQRCFLDDRWVGIRKEVFPTSVPLGLTVNTTEPSTKNMSATLAGLSETFLLGSNDCGVAEIWRVPFLLRHSPFFGLSGWRCTVPGPFSVGEVDTEAW